jgi:protein gp37
MGESTAISWTDHTFNPWWGCTRVSPGCQHCYAEAFAKRTGHDVWGQGGARRFFGDKHWAEPLRWDRQAEADGRPHLVFCASMADVFEDRPELVAPRADLYDVIRATPHLIWQLLTKRPENVMGMVPDAWEYAREWPSNVWIGTTVEDQQRADERIPELLAIPAPVRFLSCEPLLGPVDLWPHLVGCQHESDSGLGDNLWRCDACGAVRREVEDPDGPVHVMQLRPRRDYRARYDTVQPGRPGIDWVIVGGESGPGHRPLDLDHARRIREDCLHAGVPFLFKQVGGRTPTAGGDLLDGEQLKAFPSEARRGARR